MSAVDHFFQRNANPRSPRSCSSCGRIPEAHPQPSPEIARDVVSERQIMMGAGSALVADPTEFVEGALLRARPEPVSDFLTRDLDQDGIEEALDGGNYCTWGIQQLGHVAVDHHTALQQGVLRAQALGHFAAAYELLRQAQGMRPRPRSIAGSTTVVE